MHVAVTQQHLGAAEAAHADDAAGACFGLVVPAVRTKDDVRGETDPALGADARGLGKVLVPLHVDPERALVGHPFVARRALVGLAFRAFLEVVVTTLVGLQ